MVFLLIRTPFWDKYQPDSFPRKRQSPAPDCESLAPKTTDQKRQKQVTEHIRQVQANYFIDRRLF